MSHNEDASSSGSNDGNTYESMFRYDFLCLHYITRNNPGYTAAQRKNSCLAVQAISEAWRESCVKLEDFKDVPSQLLQIIPPNQLAEFTRLKEDFIAKVITPESEREGGIILENDVNPNIHLKQRTKGFQEDHRRRPSSLHYCGSDYSTFCLLRSLPPFAT
jgi:hypothetical protein